MMRVQVYEGTGKEPAIKRHWQARRFVTTVIGLERFRIELINPTADTFVKIDELKDSTVPVDVTLNKMYVGRRRIESIYFSYGDQQTAVAGYTRKITITWTKA